MKNIIFILLLIFSSSVAFSATDKRNKKSALARTRELVAEIKKASFPELSETIVQVELFSSESDYFVTRLSVARFLSGRRIIFLLKVNPKVFALAAPEEGLRAIIAHELGHVVWLKQKNRADSFKVHHFVAKSQSKYLRDLKENLPADTAIVLLDFAENYGFLVKDSTLANFFENKIRQLFTLL